MKRISAITGLLFVSALALAAAVWDGSAVAGVAGDFPDDGYYGACNSFPRDTSVTVTNLENGKSVTVTITRNVDNPGVFIALSPKAASQLGMRAGTATRIRAVALVASQAESSLPPTRAGESADPDYNPKVYVEREKAAAAAAAAAPLAAPLAPAQAAAPQTATQPAAATAAVPAAAPESAEVLAKVGEPKKQQTAMPSLTEPKSSAAVAAPAAAAKPAAAAAAPAAVVAAVPAEKPKQPKASEATSPKPEASSSYGGTPRTTAVAAVLPSPALPASSKASSQAPEVVGGEAKPSPRKATAPRLVYIEPPLPSAKGQAAAAAKAPDKASVDALKRPSAAAGPYGFALVEPKPEYAPDQLPDAVMNRVIAPTKVVPTPVLAEAETPKNLGDLRTKPEAIACERPSYAEAVEAALAEALVLTPAEAYALNKPAKAQGEESSAGLADAVLPGSPEAVAADRAAARENGALAELQTPDVPRPVEGLAGDKPAGVVGVAAVGSLDEPGVSTPASTGTGPLAVADMSRKGPAESSTGALGEPDVPSPTESLARGGAKSVAQGQAAAVLAEPDPTGKGTSALAAEKPAKAATPGTGDLASPAVPSPTESLAAEHPAVVAGGERAVTLEPATPRPPASATPAAAAAPAAAPAAAMVPAKPSPATVATVTGPKPAGALQPPASVPVLKGLAKGSYYVQIGVYGTNDALNSAVAGFKSTHYPLAVEKLTTKKGEAAYRLFVGPLSRDESGLVLIKIRSLGYKDAYIRQGT